ncbi:MAG: alpha/beta hydrolase [Candidatus Methylomirabilales bacterium]
MRWTLVYGRSREGRLLTGLLLMAFAVTAGAPGRMERAEGVDLTWQLERLPTRPDVKQPVLIGQPGGETRGAVILLPGGSGASHFWKAGDGFHLGPNFLVRSAHLFGRAGFAAAIVDVPSDYSGGMSDSFRMSPDHLHDIRAVVSFLDEREYGPIFLIGTSRGTLSVAYLATAMRDHRIKGIVLTGSMYSIEDSPLASITYPILFVHHLYDGCRVTPYDSARRHFELISSSARKDFVTVRGGSGAISKSCEPLSEHGFIGKEAEVVQAITNWLQGKPVPETVE